MHTDKKAEELLDRYCRLLGLERKKPDLEFLGELLYAQISKIPFENISKIYFKKQSGICGMVDFEMYLNGIENHHFGGTCYALNYYL